MGAGSLEEWVVRLSGGPRPDPGELAAGDWQDALADRIDDHRLGPLLHWRWHDEPAIPVALRSRWAASHRAAALAALAQRAELIALTRTLVDHSIAGIALKGAWLAWHAYPDPATRPLRDLDLLVEPGEAMAARAMLLADGWQEGDSQGLAAEVWLARYKHLPPLFSPRGTVLELHTRLWDDDPRLPLRPDGLHDRSIADPDHDELRFPGAGDMLMHLAVHACCHRFDGGPLMLIDFDRLLDRCPLDWDAIWDRAASAGWARMVALCLAGARRWIARDPGSYPDLPVVPPAQLVEALPHLLAKPLAAREGDLAAAKLARPDLSFAQKARRAFARRERFATTGGYLAWLGSEISGARTARSQGRASQIAALDRWLLG